MGRTRKIILASAAAAVASGTLGMAVAVAAPTGTVTPHQHYAVATDGHQVRVGPNACLYGKSIAFDNFHNNGHKGVPGDLGVIVRGDC